VVQITEPRPTTVWYLQLDELKPSSRTADVRRAEVPFGPLNKLFYTEIGKDFHWTHQLHWDAAQWQRHAERVELWIVHDRGTPAGYAELLPRDGGCEIQTFGLLEPFRGKGLGGALLTRVVRRAQELAGDGGEVTLNTCELDGPHARANYEARGFTLVRQTSEDRARLVEDLLH